MILLSHEVGFIFKIFNLKTKDYALYRFENRLSNFFSWILIYPLRFKETFKLLCIVGLVNRYNFTNLLLISKSVFNNL